MNKKAFIGLGVGIAVAVLAVWGFIEGRKEFALEQERERPVQVPSRVVAHADGTAVVFDADTQKRADIAVEPVQKTTRRGEIEALAMVLPAQELIDLRNTHIAAQTQADKSQAALQASRREYERVKALHGEEQNLSLKTLETAEAAWRADEAVARGAEEALDAVGRGARQKWGGVLASAISGNAPLFRRLAEQQEVLLRVATPSGTGVTKAPATVRVAANDGSFRTARLISPSPQADPRIQGTTFFYAAPADGLLPGTTLTAYLPTGAEQSGGIVPAAAVVWWQGKAWIYQRSAPDRFVRKELPAATPVEQGWFAPGMLKGTELVVRGAQMLLSEELRAQIQVGEEGK
ncbi:hypothetical protein GCM10027399_31050 [Curvibacter fontanus]